MRGPGQHLRAGYSGWQVGSMCPVPCDTPPFPANQSAVNCWPNLHQLLCCLSPCPFLLRRVVPRIVAALKPAFVTLEEVPGFIVQSFKKGNMQVRGG